jgi:hypothetical protein
MRFPISGVSCSCLLLFDVFSAWRLKQRFLKGGEPSTLSQFVKGPGLIHVSSRLDADLCHRYTN